MRQLITAIRNIGIYPDLTIEEIVKVKLINTVFLMALGICFILGFIAFLNHSSPFQIVVIIAVLLQLLGFFLLYKQAYDTIPYYVIIELMTLFFIYNTFLIKHIGSEFILLIIIYLVYVFFESNRVRFLVVPFIVALYFLSNYFHTLIPPYYHIAIPSYLYLKQFLFVFYVFSIGHLINYYHTDVIRQKEIQQQLIEELYQKNQKVVEITTELERFNYIASHDLKSPLRNIISFLGLANMKLERKQYESVATQLVYVNTATQQMETLVNDIIAFSAANQTVLKAEAIDLPLLIKEIIETLQPQLNHYYTQVYFNELPTIYADYEAIKIVFQHLIKNGLQYNISKTPIIHISYKATGKHIVFQFKDNGIGILPIYQQQVFEYFKRLHTYDAYQGSGLGLGISRKIIQQLDGTIQVESTQGLGTTFCVQLPLFTTIKTSKHR